MIRRAGPGDVNALHAIAAAAYHTYVPRTGWNPAPMTAGYPQPVRGRQARAAVKDGKISGFAILIARPGYQLPGNAARPARRPGPRDRRGCLPWPKTTPAASISARYGSAPMKP